MSVLRQLLDFTKDEVLLLQQLIYALRIVR
jgi:hypothetical protein